MRDPADKPIYEALIIPDEGVEKGGLANTSAKRKVR